MDEYSLEILLGDMIIAVLFFQAVDVIRDGTVTGVQTCALPIYPGVLQGPRRSCPSRCARPTRTSSGQPRNSVSTCLGRSEERRVGKSVDLGRGRSFYKKRSCRVYR